MDKINLKWDSFAGVRNVLRSVTDEEEILLKRRAIGFDVTIKLGKTLWAKMGKDIFCGEVIAASQTMPVVLIKTKENECQYVPYQSLFETEQQLKTYWSIK